MTEQEQERVIIRDNRKIDPKTGEARKPAGDAGAFGAANGAAPAAESAAGEPAAEGQVPMVEAALLDERTADLQRLQAEFANYRRRAERERLAAGEAAVGRALAELLPVLDDLDRARAHGDLNGALKAVADTLDAVVGKLGLVAFGDVGDAFDPAVHEAVLHEESDAVDQPTCTTVMRRGYRHGERLLRPAMVGVSEPPAGSNASTSAEETSMSAPEGTEPGDPETVDETALEEASANGTDPINEGQQTLGSSAAEAASSDGD